MAAGADNHRPCSYAAGHSQDALNGQGLGFDARQPGCADSRADGNRRQRSLDGALARAFVTKI